MLNISEATALRKVTFSMSQCAQEGKFVLEVVDDQLRGMIAPESESFGGPCLESSEVLMAKSALPQRGV